MVQEVEILPRGRHGHIYTTKSITWLMLAPVDYAITDTIVYRTLSLSRNVIRATVLSSQETMQV